MKAMFAAASNRWWLLLPVLIALVLALWQTQSEHGWLEMALGEHSWLFWTAALTWVGLVVAAIRRHRAWWLLVTAPVVLYPAAGSLLLFLACAGGDCL